MCRFERFGTESACEHGNELVQCHSLNTPVFLFLPVIMSNISLITLIVPIFYLFILPNSENNNCPRSCICLIIIMTAFSLVILSITMASAFTGASYLDIPLPPMSHNIKSIFIPYMPPFWSSQFLSFLLLASLKLQS